MRSARLQTNDLGRADHFFGSLLSRENVKETDNPSSVEPIKAAQANGASLPFRDPKPRFSDPPAPPPQQPLPEKPDVARPLNFDPTTPSLKRSNTERPRSVPSVSPIRQEPASQIVSLVEALASAKKEIDTQSARMRDLEEMLQKERQARELAEEVAKRFELQSSDPKANGFAKSGFVESIIEEAFEPPSEASELAGSHESKTGNSLDPITLDASTSQLERRLESMVADMQQMKVQLESFKHRAETAEAERDTDRKTLVEMVEKIRVDESSRRSSSTERARSPDHKADNGSGSSIFGNLETLPEEDDSTNAKLVRSLEQSKPGQPVAGTLTKSENGHARLLYHATPYASMLGVVLLGMGLMAYLNEWQPPKVDR